MTHAEKFRLTMKAEIFKAIGQPTRLAIMEIIQDDEMQVGHIAAYLGTNAPNVSRHLALLRKQGLVVDRKEGPSIFYRGTIPHLMRFIWCAERAVRRRLNARSEVKTSASEVSPPPGV